MRAPPIVASAFAALVCGACATRPIPDLGQLYDRAASEHHPDQNPIVLVPGILGSNLEQAETGRVVWGAFTGDYANPNRADGARLVALPMQPGAELSATRDDVVENGALSSLRLRFFGLPIGISAYVNILLALGVGGYRDEELGLAGAVDYGDDHFTCFQFAYDWRRDVSESAARLHEFLDDKERYVRAEWARRGRPAPEEVRFDVVAHSMGGLVLRYYLRHGAQPLPADGSLPALTWAGAKRIERAVLVAPPNAGSGQTFVDLLEGTRLSRFLPRYPAAVLGTMPAVYQLLPRGRHAFWVAGADGEPAIDPLDPELWAERGWGLADPAQDKVLKMLLPDVDDEAERRRIALDHQAKCLRRARQFFAAMDRPAEPPEGTELYLVAGDAISTLSSVRVGDEAGDLQHLTWAPGDGTVLRSSALLDERIGAEWTPVLRSPIRWSRVMFLFKDHLGLTQSPEFIDNLLYLLLEEPRS